MINFRYSKKILPTRRTRFTRVSDYPKQLPMGLGGPRRVFAAVQEDFMQINLVARSGVSAWAVAPWFCGCEVNGEAGNDAAAGFHFLPSTQDIHSSF
jgi:hypothetical protein